MHFVRNENVEGALLFSGPNICVKTFYCSKISITSGGFSLVGKTSTTVFVLKVSFGIQEGSGSLYYYRDLLCEQYFVRR